VGPVKPARRVTALAGVSTTGTCGGTLGMDKITHPRKLVPKHLLVQEQQCCQGLVLCRGSDLRLGGERRKKRPDLDCAHGLGMVFALEYDEPRNPADVGFLGARAVVERRSATRTRSRRRTSVRGVVTGHLGRAERG
jgi:hypothetical protein